MVVGALSFRPLKHTGQTSPGPGILSLRTVGRLGAVVFDGPRSGPGIGPRCSASASGMYPLFGALRKISSSSDVKSALHEVSLFGGAVGRAYLWYQDEDSSGTLYPLIKIQIFKLVRQNLD